MELTCVLVFANALCPRRRSWILFSVTLEYVSRVDIDNFMNLWMCIKSLNAFVKRHIINQILNFLEFSKNVHFQLRKFRFFYIIDKRQNHKVSYKITRKIFWKLLTNDIILRTGFYIFICSKMKSQQFTDLFSLKFKLYFIERLLTLKEYIETVILF